MATVIALAVVVQPVLVVHVGDGDVPGGHVTTEADEKPGSENVTRK